MSATSTKQQPDAFARRLTDMETWLTDSRAALGAFARAAGCRLQDAAHVLQVMVRCSTDGRCDLTTEQLARKTLLSDAQVKRALKALTDAGAVLQVMPGRSAGCNGGRGRGAVRRLTMIGPYPIGPIGTATPEPAQPEPEDCWRWQHPRTGELVSVTSVRQTASVTYDRLSDGLVIRRLCWRWQGDDWELCNWEPTPDCPEPAQPWEQLRTGDWVPAEVPWLTPEPAQPDAPADRMAVQFSSNGSAVRCTPLRSIPYGNHLRAESLHNADAVQTPVPEAPATTCQVQGENEETSEPTSAPVAPVVNLRRHSSTAPAPAPQRRAFPSVAEWCTAMAAHAAANPPQPDPEPAQYEPTQPEPVQQPDARKALAIATAAGRLYAQAEHAAGRCKSLPALTRWAADQHLTTLRDLCSRNSNWCRWVTYGSAESVATALYYFQQDRMLQNWLVDRLNSETEQQLQHSHTG